MYYKNVIGFPPAPAHPIVFDMISREVEDAFINKGYVFMHVGNFETVEDAIRAYSFNNTRRNVERWLNEVPERKAAQS